MYGAVCDWHTVEGAAVLCHDGRYFCCYSGGAWERDNYGVSWVVADDPLGPYTCTPGTSQLQIAGWLLKGYEAGLVSDRLLDATVLHELTHYFDWRDNSPYPTEAGRNFEIYVWGATVNK